MYRYGIITGTFQNPIDGLDVLVCDNTSNYSLSHCRQSVI